MEVKDIRLFRKWLKNETDNENKDENFIGFSYPYNTDGRTTTKARGFFNVYHNQSKDIDARLSTVLDMAQDSQAIYEFVQNAVDCDSTAYFMFYEDNHFVAINNGKPFNLEGIRAILNFAQSTKTRDENIGKFGVGFKLIHRMVGAGNGLQELTQDYTGPILFSWSNKNQLTDLLNANSITDITTNTNEDWDSSTAPWFFKILLTCVPILPNNIDKELKDIHYKERNDLFTEEEFLNFKNFLSGIWEQNQDKFTNEDLNQGSLFYLRLGSDKEEKLDEDYSYFKKGIQYSLSFVANLMNKKGLQKIYFKNEEPIEKENIDLSLEPPFIIEPNSDEFEEIKPKLKENDKTRNINFVFGYQQFENNDKYGELRDSPNFYKFFPMGKEVCGLNFIVHSNIFEIEASRREFVQKDKRNIFILEKLSQKLQQRLDNYKQSAPDIFDNIFLSILFSNEPNHQQWQWITAALYKPLLDYITKNCPTDKKGEFQPASTVVIKDTELSIQPSDFGITNKFWFKWNKTNFENIKTTERKKDTSYDKLIKNSWSVTDLIKEGNLNSIKLWYSNADKETKEILHSELIENWNYVTDAKFWSKIVEIPELIDQVIEANEQKVKYNYIKNLGSIKLPVNKKYTIDDFEFKVLSIAVEVLRATTDIDEFRNKVLVIDSNNDTHKLFDVRENDKIVFKNSSGNDWLLNLSDVLPTYKNKSGLLHQIISSFEKLELKLHTLFGIGRQKPIDDVYKHLIHNHQKITTPFQFVFLGLYSADKNADFFKNFDFEKLKSGDVLDIYFKNKYPFPKKFANYIDNFNPELSVFPDEWAIKEERLPLSIRKWIEKDESENKLKFLSDKAIGINNEESNIVKIRKAFKGQLEVTQNHITLVSEKNISLLLNTMKWLQAEETILKEDNQIQTIQKLLKTYYTNVSVDYDTEHPQLYIHKVKVGDIMEYKFLPNNEDDFYIDNSKIKEIQKFGLTLKQIFDVAQKNLKPIFDFRMYPESELSKSDWTEIEIVQTPDFDKIHNNSWSFDLPFFIEWEHSIDNKVLFFHGTIPQLIQFENEILREHNEGNCCKNEATGNIYININPALDNIAKAETIVESIKELPEDYLSYHEKKSLDIAYWKWKEGENPNVNKIRKQQLKDAEEYSFEWLKALFDWEYDATIGSHKPYTVWFEKVEFKNNCIVLGECSFETIPSRIEFHPDPIELMIKRKNESRKVVCSISNFNEFELTLQPMKKVDIDYFQNFKALEGYRANFKLPGDDVLMDRLRENLFGSKAIAPKAGSITEFFQTNFHDNRISFLFGPPGTGKTTKVALDILTTLSFNHLTGNNTKILVLTPTNKAADVVIERLVELLADENKLKEIALTYYPEASVNKLITYCKNIFSTKDYQDIFVRYGNSASSTLLQHNILKSRYTLKEIFPNLVLATTVHRLAFDEIVGNQLKDPAVGWTHIVIDEASMVSLPHSVYTLLQFQSLADVKNQAGLLSTFTISGDPFQIQPVGQTPNYIEQGIEGMKGWGTENIYTLFGLTNFGMSRTPIGNFAIKKLLTQYRSVPIIGELFSKYKYDGQIRHKQKQNSREIELGDSFLENISLVNFPVFDEDTATQEDIFNIHKYGEFSAYHIYSIVLSCELASAIKLQNPSKTVSIITPYGTQARLTKEISYAFRNQNFENHFDVSTIHRYQGDENDVVILVMNPPKTKPFEYSHFNNSFLINVGISRAKESLIIFHPENIAGYSEIDEAVKPLCENLNEVYCAEIESTIFQEHKHNGTSKKIKDIVEVNGFQTFNVCDLKEFTASGKEYLFFADSRELGKGEKRYANVIVNISKRHPIIHYIQPKKDLVVVGTITGIHKNNKTAFVKIRNIKDKAVIHNNAISNNFVSDINQVLHINQKIKAKIQTFDEKGITLTMKGIKQE
jgi:hypothetical protein